MVHSRLERYNHNSIASLLLQSKAHFVFEFCHMPDYISQETSGFLSCQAVEHFRLKMIPVGQVDRRAGGGALFALERAGQGSEAVQRGLFRTPLHPPQHPTGAGQSQSLLLATTARGPRKPQAAVGVLASPAAARRVNLPARRMSAPGPKTFWDELVGSPRRVPPSLEPLAAAVLRRKQTGPAELVVLTERCRKNTSTPVLSGASAAPSRIGGAQMQQKLPRAAAVPAQDAKALKSQKVPLTAAGPVGRCSENTAPAGLGQTTPAVASALGEGIQKLQEVLAAGSARRLQQLRLADQTQEEVELLWAMPAAAPASDEGYQKQQKLQKAAAGAAASATAEAQLGVASELPSTECTQFLDMCICPLTLVRMQCWSSFWAQ